MANFGKNQPNLSLLALTNNEDHHISNTNSHNTNNRQDQRFANLHQHANGLNLGDGVHLQNDGTCQRYNDNQASPPPPPPPVPYQPIYPLYPAYPTYPPPSGAGYYGYPLHPAAIASNGNIYGYIPVRSNLGADMIAQDRDVANPYKWS